MKCFYYLLFVLTVSNARNCRGKQNYIPAPTIRSVTPLDPPAFEISWSPVQNTNEDEPVLGYKVKVWEVPEMKTFAYEVVNGERVLVEQDPPKPVESENLDDNGAKVIIINGEDTTEATIPKVKINVLYEIRVNAFAAHVEGPPCAPIRMKLKGPDVDDLDIYTVS